MASEALVSNEASAALNDVPESVSKRVAGRMSQWLQNVHQAVSRCCPFRREVRPRMPTASVLSHGSDDDGQSAPQTTSSSSCAQLPSSTRAVAASSIADTGPEEGADRDPWQKMSRNLDWSVSGTPSAQICGTPLAVFSRERSNKQMEEAMEKFGNSAEESTHVRF